MAKNTRSELVNEADRCGHFDQMDLGEWRISRCTAIKAKESEDTGEYPVLRLVGRDDRYEAQSDGSATRKP